MNFKIRLLLFLLITVSTINSQSNTFFIKYYSNVSKSEIETKVTTKQFLPEAATNQIQANVLAVDHLAKGDALNDEILGQIIKVTIDNEADQFLLDQIKNIDNNIEYIQEANIYKMDIVPNDTMITQQWALEKIKAFDAWDKTQGSEEILLGIIDTGIDYFHPDLENKLYTNPGETGIDNFGNDKKSNGIDDDNNGFVDDHRGWDFTDRVGFPFDSSGGDYLDWDNDPMDEQGHGTYISGIAIAEVNNTAGIAGVAPNLKMINLRAFDPSGYGEEDDVAAAILYAVQMGVKVINMSFGDNAFSLVLRDVIRYAYSQNVVLVGSAGNSGSSSPHYPSGYSEVICVGNSTIDDFVAGNSNFGSTLDMVAPGSLILTTARNNNYSIISGTSAATPHVTAAAGLILSIQEFTNEEIKQILKSTTDDISSPGWDLRSGAGRLNLFRAVTVVAPSIIKFNHPTQDFATLEDELTINATVLSPLFSSYDLYFGTGLNPTDWNSLISNGLTQFSNEDIYNLELSSLPDSVYTLRLVVQFTNGRTMEERVNFSISRTPPNAELISRGPAFYGDKTTIMAAMYTDEPSVTRMYYKRPSEIDYNFVTLDGFTINNQFVKYLHYGFIPKQLVEQNAVYEVYFEAENLVGLTTVIKNNGSDFIFITNYDAEIAGETEMPFSLPAGDIFHNPVNITSNDLNEIFIREFTNSRISNLYKFNNNSFEFVDSLHERIIKDFGDFNNNGLKDLLTFFVRDGFVYEQDNPNSSNLVQKFSDVSGEFWPIMAKDIDNDNRTEIAVVKNDTLVNVWTVNPDLSLSNPVELRNFTEPKFGSNILNAPNSVIADINGDGINEMWFVDLDGDIYSYEIRGDDNYQEGSIIPTEFLGSAAFIASGDYNGDLIDDLAVLLHSVEELDVAPFYRLIIFNLVGNTFNTLYDQALIDAASEFSSSFQQSENSVRFSDIDNDGVDELILFMFPYSYIFKDKFGSDKIISYKENINSNAIFIADLNNNGVQEVAFPTEQGIKFYEFANSNKAFTPYNLSGHSVDSSRIHLTWSGNADQYYIYRGSTNNSLQKIDSVFNREYIDQNLQKNVHYYYAIQANDLTKPEPLSNLSAVLNVFSHTPGIVISAIGSSSNSVTVTFSEKMSNTIENLQGFELLNMGIPNSVAPANQFSYLLTFNDDIPIGTNSLLVRNIRDLYGSPIEEANVVFFMDSVIVDPEFFITSFEIINSYLVRVVFNVEVDEISAGNTANYVFNPSNNASSITVNENDKRIIHISLEGEKPVGSIGREYVLQLQNITSSVATGNIPINKGAGSFIVLSNFAKDLSDVYVYPNPANVNNGEGIITFANLPQRAKITIWSLNGTQVNELEETNGDGGITFNLRDYSGDYLSSGIYVYRIVMLDDVNNESEEKLGKFAVVR